MSPWYSVIGPCWSSVSDTVCNSGDKRARTLLEVGERSGNSGEESWGITCRFLLSLMDDRWKSVLLRLADGCAALVDELLCGIEVAPIDVGGWGTTWLFTEADFLP